MPIFKTILMSGDDLRKFYVDRNVEFHFFISNALLYQN